MLIFDEHDRPIILDNIADPIPSEFFWSLDLSMMDYTLSNITFLEDHYGPSVTLDINGFRFDVPTYWCILIADADETSQLDVAELKKTGGRCFSAVVDGPTHNRITTAEVTVVDYNVARSHVSPALNKHQMLCHPIGPDLWINISPTDAFNKYLKNTTIGDLIA